MEVHDAFVPEEAFREFIERMPQVCVEVVVERDDGAVLLAHRTNEPARSEWFWPGSRLYKGEHLADAARRVGREELGLDLTIGNQIGVYEHRWETSAPGPSRHTINVVFRARVADGAALSVEDVTLDDQHDGGRFVQPADVDQEHHEYVRQYIEDLQTLRSS